LLVSHSHTWILWEIVETIHRVNSLPWWWWASFLLWLAFGVVSSWSGVDCWVYWRESPLAIVVVLPHDTVTYTTEDCSSDSQDTAQHFDILVLTSVVSLDFFG